MTTSSSAIKYESYPSLNSTERRGGTQPSILVMHYTACPTDEALTTLTSKAKAVSAHYLIPPEGKTVYTLVDDTQRAWHAGMSHWRGIDDINSASIGIENVNWGYTYGWVPPEPKNPVIRYCWSSMIDIERRIGEYLALKRIFPFKKQWHNFPQRQIETLSNLSKQIIDQWKIDAENVVGHSDIAPQRKLDPGPLFPWQKLAEKGIGVWYSDFIDRLHSNKPSGPSVSWMQVSLKEWGYAVPQNGKLDPETQKVVAAFQMHFRPQDHEGLLDVESMEILDKLLCQRRNKTDL
jgi:N-acetyl-anhydromuramyl-L-alanine amidase AmpD